MAHPDLMPAVVRAQLALHLNQKKLGDLMLSSQRTVQRWYAGRGWPSPSQVTRLVVAVHPREPDTARRLATAIGETLESLGVVAPPAPAPVETSPEPSPLLPFLVESVIAAAAEALDVSPRVARPAVLAAFERAKAVTLTVDDLVAVLGPPAVGKQARG